MSQIERRLSALEKSALPPAQGMRRGRYKYNEAHRCIGVIVDEKLVERRDDESKDEMTSRIQRELDAGRDWVLVDIVAAKDPAISSTRE